MTRTRLLAALASGAVFVAVLASACGVKAPPRPPVKETAAPDGGARPATP